MHQGSRFQEEHWGGLVEWQILGSACCLGWEGIGQMSLDLEQS